MNRKLDFGAFKPYTFAGKNEAVIDDHPDIALGLNAASKKQGSRTNLPCLGSLEEFAQVYANALPGFFPLANVSYTLSDPVAQEFAKLAQRGGSFFPLLLPDPVA